METTLHEDDLQPSMRIEITLAPFTDADRDRIADPNDPSGLTEQARRALEVAADRLGLYVEAGPRVAVEQRRTNGAG